MIFDPSRIEWKTTQVNGYVYIDAEYTDDAGYKSGLYNGGAEAGNEEQIYACKSSMARHIRAEILKRYGLIEDLIATPITSEEEDFYDQQE
jgi:hypothetical protein